MLVIFAHIFACVWVFFALYERNIMQESWFDRVKTDEKSLSVMYLYAFYYCTVTMVKYFFYKIWYN